LNWLLIDKLVFDLTVIVIKIVSSVLMDSSVQPFFENIIVFFNNRKNDGIFGIEVKSLEVTGITI